MSDDKLAKVEAGPEALSEEAFNQIAQAGNFSAMGQTERSIFLAKFAERMGLNWLTKPFDLIPLNGKLTLYANRTCTDQLARKYNLSVEVLDRTEDAQAETYSVRVKVKDPAGREEENIGAVGIGNLTGEAKANAMMKAYTKAKRRAILAFCGFGFLDELEIESIQGKSEEAKARGVAPSIVVSPPAQDAPRIEASSTPGQPIPPAQPPTDVK